MKTRFYILLALAAVLSFFSCERIGPEKHLSDDNNLFVDLVIKSSAYTKTSGDDEIDPTEEEAEISSVQLFLVAWDATNSKPASNTAVIKISDAEVVDNTTVGASLTMSSGQYLLYVIANCPTGLTLDLDSYEDFIGSYGKDASITNVNGSITDVTKIWEDDNFMMVNSVDGNTGTGCYNGGVLINLANQTINAEVAIERVAAKIIADQDKLIDFSASMQKVLGPYDDVAGEYVDYVISSAKIDAWALMNCVNSFNLIQKYTEDTKDFHKVNSSDPLMNVIVTPSSDDTKYPVAKKTADPTTNLKSVGYYYTNPQYTGYNTTDKKPEYTELEFVDAGETLYCLENNPSYYPTTYEKNDGTTPTPAVSDSKMKGRATAVVFRAQILLADGFDADAYTGSHDGTDPVGVDGTPGTWDEKPTKAYSTDLVKTVYEYKGRYYADATRLKADYSVLSSCDDDAALRTLGVKVYEHGYMYYTYYITKDEIPGCHSPYYCVERNKCYKFTVKSVSGLGDDLPCDYSHYDPEDPINMAIPRITVTADVLPWNVKETVTYEIQ